MGLFAPWQRSKQASLYNELEKVERESQTNAKFWDGDLLGAAGTRVNAEVQGNGLVRSVKSTAAFFGLSAKETAIPISDSSDDRDGLFSGANQAKYDSEKVRLQHAIKANNEFHSGDLLGWAGDSIGAKIEGATQPIREKLAFVGINPERGELDSIGELTAPSGEKAASKTTPSL